MQGSLRIGLIPHLSFAFLAVVFIVRCRCLRLLSDWLGVVVCVCCRICLVVSLFVLVVVFVGWCRCLRLSSDLLFGAGVSAVGTILLQSPGCNEGKARNATLGKHVHKK